MKRIMFLLIVGMILLVLGVQANITLPTPIPRLKCFNSNCDSMFVVGATDTLWFIYDSDCDCWLIGDEGMLIIDSASVFSFISFLDTANAISVTLTPELLDSIVQQKGDFAAGSGSVDSVGIVEDTVGPDTTFWSPDAPLQMSFGYGFTVLRGADVGNVRTFSIYPDTLSSLATVNHAENYADTLLINHSTSADHDGRYYTETEANSTFEVQLNNEAGLYSVLSDVSDFIQITDSGTVASGNTGLVTGRNVYTYLTNNYTLTSGLSISNWNTAYGWGDHSGLYLPLAGGTMAGNIDMNGNDIVGVDSLDGGNGTPAIYYNIPNSPLDSIRYDSILNDIRNPGITGNETITLSGDATGSGTTSIDLQLAANSVTATEIATDAVGASEISSGAVGQSEIATDGVGSLELAANAVNNVDMADNAVGSAEIINNSIDWIDTDTADIKNNLKNNYFELSDFDASTMDTTDAGKLKVVGFGDLVVNGEFEATRTISEWNRMRTWFFEGMLTNGVPDTPIAIIPSAYWDSDSATNANISVHWSVNHTPTGFPRNTDSSHSFIMVMTPYSLGSAVEFPSLYVSDNGIDFRPYTNGTNTTSNPIAGGTNYPVDLHGISNRPSNYPSDPLARFTLDDTLGIWWRETYNYASDTADGFALWMKKTADLLTFTDSTIVKSMDSTNDYLSPSIELINNSEYFLFYVDSRDEAGDQNNTDTSWIVVEKSTSAESGYSIIDSLVPYPWFPQYHPTSFNHKPFHIGTRAVSPRKIAFLVTTFDHITFKGLWDMDRGDTLFIDTLPINVNNSFDKSYKSDLLFVDNNKGGEEAWIYTSGNFVVNSSPLLYKGYSVDTSTERVEINFTSYPVKQSETSANHNFEVNLWDASSSTMVMYRDSGTSTTNLSVVSSWQGYAPQEFNPESVYVTMLASEANITYLTGLKAFTIKASDTTGTNIDNLGNLTRATITTPGGGTVGDTGNLVENTIMRLGYEISGTDLDNYYFYDGERVMLDLDMFLYALHAKVKVYNVQMVGRSLRDDWRKWYQWKIPTKRESYLTKDY